MKTAAQRLPAIFVGSSRTSRRIVVTRRPRLAKIAA
jgi:hypothetical protein